MLSVENDWKFEANVLVKVPFIVVKMISSKHFCRTSYVWDTSCFVTAKFNTIAKQTLNVISVRSPYGTPRLIKLRWTSCEF